MGYFQALTPRISFKCLRTYNIMHQKEPGGYIYRTMLILAMRDYRWLLVLPLLKTDLCILRFDIVLSKEIIIGA